MGGISGVLDYLDRAAAVLGGIVTPALAILALGTSLARKWKVARQLSAFALGLGLGAFATKSSTILILVVAPRYASPELSAVQRQALLSLGLSELLYTFTLALAFLLVAFGVYLIARRRLANQPPQVIRTVVRIVGGVLVGLLGAAVTAVAITFVVLAASPSRPPLQVDEGPSKRARVLAESIACGMNWGVLFYFLAIPLGVFWLAERPPRER